MRGLLTCLVLLAVPAQAASTAQKLYEGKCLYCHSGASAARLRMKPADWRRLVERMRSHAPLLISARDSEVIVRYLVNELKLVPSESARAVSHLRREHETSPQPPGPKEELPPPPAVAGAERCCSPSSECCATARAQPLKTLEPTEPAPEPEDVEADAKGPRLLAEKCSKCHTANRVYTKIQSIAIGYAVIDRMRRKAGSGISPADADLLKRFIRLRVSVEE